MARAKAKAERREPQWREDAREVALSVVAVAMALALAWVAWGVLP